MPFSDYLPVWNQEQIEFREAFANRIKTVLERRLREMNRAWRFERIEGSILTPRYALSDNYTDEDIFVSNHKDWVLRPETTPSSYEHFKAQRYTMKDLPLCIWQQGKSFRRELSDGASPSKLRFNEFNQLEFQCIYSVGTKANYRDAVLEYLDNEVDRYTAKLVRIVESDRLPNYSKSTTDIEVYSAEKDRWIEVASVSLRKDLGPELEVLEVAFGLDRIVKLSLDLEF